MFESQVIVTILKNLPSQAAKKKSFEAEWNKVVRSPLKRVIGVGAHPCIG
jgi:hypothetical protein